MDKELIISLIDKYFDGRTTLGEERQLREYFRQRRIAPELKSYAPMFRFFANERNEGVNNNVRALKIVFWTALSAAACLLLFFGLNFDEVLKKPDNQAISIAFIDGRKHTDMETIRFQTLQSLEILADGADDACTAQLEAINGLTE